MRGRGFRRITFFPDGPTFFSKYQCADGGRQSTFSGSSFERKLRRGGEADRQRHWAKWEDPFPKPCYLFAWSPETLEANRDSFTTMTGRKVDLAIWVRAADFPGPSMRWTASSSPWLGTRSVYGREYDLDQFNIVAVSDFNMGAMENKSLNIFNSAYVLADQETATDADFDNIARVVAHEYFHNWSGDRVTCRDWFQLSLKEGFTVFRDQSFSADIGSPPVKRIEDVRVLRAVQFPEDQGPLAHPVRPDSYIEISNFYTATVYNKGAEVIRMFHTVLAPEKFRAGTDLYFDRNDGRAATCDDFVAALEDGSGVDLGLIQDLVQPGGNPEGPRRLEHDPAKGRRHFISNRCRSNAGQSDKKTHAIPLRPRSSGSESGAEICPERLHHFDQPSRESSRSIM